MRPKWWPGKFHQPELLGSACRFMKFFIARLVKNFLDGNTLTTNGRNIFIALFFDESDISIPCLLKLVKKLVRSFPEFFFGEHSLF